MSSQYEDVERKLAIGTTADVIALKCPCCGGALLATFTDTNGKMALNIRCENHCYRTSIDGLRERPPWVEELGNKLVTERHMR